jgi:hypothetical protein
MLPIPIGSIGTRFKLKPHGPIRGPKGEQDNRWYWLDRAATGLDQEHGEVRLAGGRGRYSLRTRARL